MRYLIICTCAIAFALAYADSALALDWDAKRMDKLVADLKAGKPVMESGSLAKADAQLVTVVVNENLTYVIDYRAKVCFASQGAGQSLTFVPCQALRHGYPVLAPLLSWEESMPRRQLPSSMMRRPGQPPGAPAPGGPPPRQQQ
jgi:hypothetical protein